MKDSIDRRLLIYTAVTFLIVTLVALMLLPLGLPYFEHIISYWWADPYFKMAVGQEQKFLWYKKTFYSVLFLFWVLLSLWVWLKLLHKSRPWVLLSWAYAVFCATVIGSQFLVMGGWDTHAHFNLADMWDDCPSVVKVVDRIDSPTAFMKDMVKYAGVDGRLRGTLAIKAPTFVLMFYFIDQVTKPVIELFGFDASDLALRAAAMACGFTALIGLFLIPMFFLFQLLFSEQVARIAVFLLAMNPLAAHGFAHTAALSHHILIPVSALSLLLVCLGLARKQPAWNIAGIGLTSIAGLIVWEAFAFTGLLILINGIYFYRKGTLNRISKTQLAKAGIGLAVAVALVWAVFKIAFNLDIFVHFWDHFIVTHVGFLLHKMFVSKGPTLYILSIFTNPFCFLFFLGVPLTVQMYFSIRDQRESRLQLGKLEGFIIYGTLIFTLALDFSGMSSETSRLWAFLAPPFYVIALSEFGKIKDQRRLTALGVGLYLLLAIQILVQRNVHYAI